MTQVRWRPRWWRAILAVFLSAPLLAMLFVFWRATHAKEQATAEVLSRSQFPVRIVPIDRAAPAAVEPLAASPGFRDIAAYKEMIAVSARAGLFLYDRNGVLVHSYRAGMELPGAELARYPLESSQVRPNPSFLSRRKARACWLSTVSVFARSFRRNRDYAISRPYWRWPPGGFCSAPNARES
jgi:hypothetical protein